MTFKPVASNRPDLGLTVAGAVNTMLEKYRTGIVGDKSISIATAYINPAGYALIADELASSPRVRLLIGAEPEFEANQALSNKNRDGNQDLDAALASHDAWLAAERDLAGFSQEAVESAKAMVEWLERSAAGSPIVEVRKYKHGFLHGKAFLVESNVSSSAIAGSSNFTRAGLSLNAELNLATSGSPGHVKDIVDWFDHYWEQSEPFDLAELYKAQWAPHQPWHIFIRMLNELYGSGMDEEGATGRLGLTAFQRDGVARMRRLLKQNGGVLVADEVGLGKSYLAGEMIMTATEELRQQVLIVCPAAIKTSMWLPFLKNNGFRASVTVYSYEEVRNRMKEPEKPADDSAAAKATHDSEMREWRKFQDEVSNYALVVVDEAHNLRNSATAKAEALDQVILSGKYPKQVILLTATPVNNSLSDLETLIKYFIRDDARFANVGIPSIRSYIKRAQDTDPDNLTPEHLFDLMDQVAIRRTRKFVRDNYANDKIIDRDGNEQVIKFPTPKSIRTDYKLNEAGTQLVDAVLAALQVDDDSTNNSYDLRRDDPARLILARYTPSAYRKVKNLEMHQLTNAGLLRSALLKRLESSPVALLNTLKKLSKAHASFIKGCELGYVIVGVALNELTNSDDDEFVDILDSFDVDNRKDIEPIGDYQADLLIEDVKTDKRLLDELIVLADAASSGEDPKYNKLVEQLIEISKQAQRPDVSGAPSEDRQKVIVFSTFADTIIDLHERLEKELDTTSNPDLARYRGRLAPPILGSYAKTHAAGGHGGVDQGGRAAVLAGFAPKTAGEYVDGKYIDENTYDILLTTDVLAEGVNLQQCGMIANYDLPWNPMRIVQRHGRIDRIGSEHDYVKLWLFFPAQKLNEMLKLETTLQRKLAQAHAAVGEHIEVLATTRQQTDVILHDQSMKAMDAFLESRGGENAVSGEEFRRRLHKFLMQQSDPSFINAIPYGSGSGFVNSKIPVSGYVFCAKVGKHEKPWFRFIQVDDAWSPVVTDDGSVRMTGESLVSLLAADPGVPETARDLPDEAYSKAFDSWSVAQEDIFEKWSFLADTANLGAQQPASFRKAHDYVLEHGMFLGQDDQLSLVRRLSAVPARKVELEVGRALKLGVTPREIVLEIQRVLDDAGIQAPPKVQALPPVEKHEVRLVTWMAVRGTGKRH